MKKCRYLLTVKFDFSKGKDNLKFMESLILSWENALSQRWLQMKPQIILEVIVSISLPVSQVEALFYSSLCIQGLA